MKRRSTEKDKTVAGSGRESDAYRLLRSHRHRRKPAKAVRLLPADDAEKFTLQEPRDGTNRSIANGNTVD